MRFVNFFILLLLIISSKTFAKSQESNTLKIQIKSEMAKDFSQLAKDTLPSFVTISTTQDGSGFIISKEGHILTNYHLVEEAQEIIVSTIDETKYRAKILAIDKRTDLALLKISPIKELKPIKFGDSTKVKVGEWIFVIGNPFGIGASISVGIVSALNRDVGNSQIGDEFIQTDAAINKGNSGGPMFNSDGEVIGINTMLYSPSGGSVGIGFATPSSIVSSVAKQLKEQGEVIRGSIGISVRDISSDMVDPIVNLRNGAFVVDVAKDGAAERAGIMASDIIVKFGDQEITNSRTLSKLIMQSPINKNINLTINRRGKNRVVNVRVMKMI